MKTWHLILGAVILSILWQPEGEAGQARWHTEGNVKWADLELSKPGKTGFTQLPPEQTGINFTNVLDEWSSAANRILENGGGVAVGDFDGDGRPDIFLCSLTGRNALYRNLGGWRFEDVTFSAGVIATNYICRGAVFADIDGDGRLDLLISTLGHGVLCFLNDGKGRFADVTQSAGTETRFGSTTMTLADIDGNGTLDLYVANYRTDDIRDRSRVPVQMVNGRMVAGPGLQGRVVVVKEGLLEYGEPDILYLNDGKGHFNSVPWTGGTFLDESGKTLAAQPRDWGLTATFRDMNGDGFPDLYVCNDYWTPDRIWINDGTGGFRAIARPAVRHGSENSMGVDFADIDRDGHVDFLVLDMLSRNPALRKRQVLAQTKMISAIGEIDNRPQIMRNSLFHNRGDDTFEEVADFSGVPASEWSWQAVFVDVDLDGYEDLVIPAGHTRDIQDLDASLKIKSLQHPWPKNIDPKAHQEAFTREMMEHARLYPGLERPIVAFRNLGDLRFEDVTAIWGTSAPGVHQGIAFGDFDGDGDLDFVVNNLNGACGLYRNDGTAPRVAVRLKGIPPNTQGIGAKIKLLDGAVPMQSQEVVCGGRYLSGSDSMLVFAAGTPTNEMRIEVRWRNGKLSVVDAVKANRIYEVDEAGAIHNQQPTTNNPPAPLFEDVSSLISHTHHEDPFDDFERQPLLPRKLSQLGPGIAWGDVDGDGWEDLMVGSGKGGRFSVYRNDGRGGFKQLTGTLFDMPVTRDQTGILWWKRDGGQGVLLAGAANYEDGLAVASGVRQYDLTRNIVDEILPAQESSTGPLALAEIDGRGSWDLFVGGRVIPGRYPEPASSRIYRYDGTKFQLDAENSKTLAGVGLVSGAVWSDLDSDGYPELILACEWGPIRVFKIEAGILHETTAEWGLSRYTGWWTGVTTGDIDGDGRPDIVAGNWGLNTPYRASPEHPLRLYYGDLMGHGAVDIVETEYDADRQATVPRHRLDYMAAGLPFLRDRFATSKAYSDATIDESLGDLRLRASIAEVNTLATTVFFNRHHRFEAVALPREAQFAPAFSVLVSDCNGDGNEDIFLSQNFFDLPWEMHRLDAGRGLLLQGDGKGKLRAVPGEESGIKVYGEQRGAALCDYDADGRVDLVVTQNGAETKMFHNIRAKPGVRVRLKGPSSNLAGVGAQIRLHFGERAGPVREVHAGSGYWSQDSVVQVMGRAEIPARIDVLWPGGKTTSAPLPQGAREIEVDVSGNLHVVR